MKTKPRQKQTRQLHIGNHMHMHILYILYFSSPNALKTKRLGFTEGNFFETIAA